MQDSSPERRNLLMTSVAFIAYFYAGGTFPNSIVSLQVVNADFSKPEILGWIAWIAFFWFLYRYWLVHRGAFNSAFAREFSLWQSRPNILNYAMERIDGEMAHSDEKEGNHIEDIKWNGSDVIITFAWGGNVQRDEDGLFRHCLSMGPGKAAPPIVMNDLHGRALSMKSTMACVLKYPSFSSYIVPYILAIIAMVGAIL